MIPTSAIDIFVTTLCCAVLGSIDARGIVTSFDSDRPGSVGNVYVSKHSVLWQNIFSG